MAVYSRGTLTAQRPRGCSPMPSHEPDEAPAETTEAPREAPDFLSDQPIGPNPAVIETRGPSWRRYREPVPADQEDQEKASA